MVKSVITAFTCAMSILLFSCNSSSKGKKYPDDVRNNFVNGCAGKLPPQYKGNCECMLEKIEQQYSLSDYAKIEADIKAGNDVSTFLAFTDSARKQCFPGTK
jgi:hypothetical protein